LRFSCITSIYIFNVASNTDELSKSFYSIHEDVVLGSESFLPFRIHCIEDNIVGKTTSRKILSVSQCTQMAIFERAGYVIRDASSCWLQK
jgi:hypothetical protein